MYVKYIHTLYVYVNVFMCMCICIHVYATHLFEHARLGVGTVHNGHLLAAAGLGTGVRVGIRRVRVASQGFDELRNASALFVVVSCCDEAHWLGFTGWGRVGGGVGVGVGGSDNRRRCVVVAAGDGGFAAENGVGHARDGRGAAVVLQQAVEADGGVVSGEL